MHFRHRSVCIGPADRHRPLARRLAPAIVAPVATVLFALSCPAQGPEQREGAADPAVPNGRASTTSLQERLRLFHQRRRNPGPKAETSPPDGDRWTPRFARDAAGRFETAFPRARSGVDSLTLRDPRRLNAMAGSPGFDDFRVSDDDGDPSYVGLSSPVFVPTQHPNEVVDPGDGVRPASAMIPEVIPRTDVADDPNLLPPPQTPPHTRLSTWQQVRQRGIVFQNSYLRSTWLSGGGDRLGMFDVFAQATFGFPLLPGVSFTPSFQVNFLDGPARTDLPARLYAVQAEIRSLLPIGQSFVLDLSVIPGVFSDFEQGDSDSFRIQGRAIGVYILSPTSQLVFGILYLDRFDINVLPTGGWIYAPNADWRFELLFPRPKIGMRLSQTADYSRWAYLAGEFGGDAWTVQRVDGTTDRLVYRDLRLIVGIEQKYANGRLLFLEAGYVFDRKVEFESERGDFDPSSTGMMRAGLVY